MLLNEVNHRLAFAKAFHRSRCLKNQLLENIAFRDQSDKELTFSTLYFLIFERSHRKRCFR